MWKLSDRFTESSSGYEAEQVGLDPMLFNEINEPHKNVKDHLSKTVHKALAKHSGLDSDLFDLFLAGPATGMRYNPISDLDVYVLPAYDQIPAKYDKHEFRKHLTEAMAHKVDGTHLPGSQHRIHAFIVKPGETPDSLFGDPETPSYSLSDNSWYVQPSRKSNTTHSELSQQANRAERIKEKVRLLLRSKHSQVYKDYLKKRADEEPDSFSTPTQTLRFLKEANLEGDNLGDSNTGQAEVEHGVREGSIGMVSLSLGTQAHSSGVDEEARFIRLAADVQQLAQQMQQNLLNRPDIQQLQEAAAPARAVSPIPGATPAFTNPQAIEAARLYDNIDTFLSAIAREYPAAYKLMPWGVKQIKSWDHSSPPAASLSHLFDIVGQAGTMINEMRQQNKLPQGFDVNQMTFEQLESWLYEQRAQGLENGWENPNHIFTTSDGWNVDHVTTENDLAREGELMGHCVGGYYPQVENGSSLIYSLRDPKGHPHATMEIEGQNHIPPLHPGNEQGWYHDNETQTSHQVDPWGIVQIQGKQNQEPLDEYKARLKEFFQHHQAQGAKFALGDDDQDYIQGPSDMMDWYENRYPIIGGESDGDDNAYGVVQHTPGPDVWADLVEECVNGIVRANQDGFHRYEWQGNDPDEVADAIVALLHKSVDRHKPSSQDLIGMIEKEYWDKADEYRELNFDYMSDREYEYWKNEYWDADNYPKDFDEEGNPVEDPREVWNREQEEESDIAEKVRDYVADEFDHESPYRQVGNFLKRVQSQLGVTSSWKQASDLSVIYNSERDHILLGDAGANSDDRILGTYDGQDVHLDQPSTQWLSDDHFKKLWETSFPDRPLEKIHVRTSAWKESWIKEAADPVQTYQKLLKRPDIANSPELQKLLEAFVKSHSGQGCLGNPRFMDWYLKQIKNHFKNHNIDETFEPHQDYWTAFVDQAVKIFNEISQAKPAPDLFTMTLEEADKWANETQNNRYQDENRWQNKEVVYNFKGADKGWTIDRLTHRDDFTTEGDLMGMCIGGSNYWGRHQAGQTDYFSLRDPRGLPHATFELLKTRHDNDESGFDEGGGGHPSWTNTPEGPSELVEVPGSYKVLQAFGKSDQPPSAKYRAMIGEFFQAWGVEEESNRKTEKNWTDSYNHDHHSDYYWDGMDEAPPDAINDVDDLTTFMYSYENRGTAHTYHGFNEECYDDDGGDGAPGGYFDLKNREDYGLTDSDTYQSFEGKECEGTDVEGRDFPELDLHRLMENVIRKGEDLDEVGKGLAEYVYASSSVYWVEQGVDSLGRGLSQERLDERQEELKKYNNNVDEPHHSNPAPLRHTLGNMATEFNTLIQDYVHAGDNDAANICQRVWNKVVQDLPTVASEAKKSYHKTMSSPYITEHQPGQAARYWNPDNEQNGYDYQHYSFPGVPSGSGVHPNQQVLFNDVRSPWSEIENHDDPSEARNQKIMQTVATVVKTYTDQWFANHPLPVKREWGLNYPEPELRMQMRNAIGKEFPELNPDSFANQIARAYHEYVNELQSQAPQPIAPTARVWTLCA